MIYQWACDRMQVAELLAGHATPPRNEVVSQANFAPQANWGQVDMLWATNPTERFSLPRCMVVADDELRDFVAWISTYFRQIRPFTAHCRILSQTTSKFACRSGKSEWPDQLRSADIAITIAEAVAYLNGNANASSTQYAYCTRTLSNSLAQLFRRYATPRDIDEVLIETVKRGWILARERAGHDSLPLLADQILDVWLTVLSISQSFPRRRKVDRLVSDALSSIVENGKILQHEWKTLARNIDSDDSLWGCLEGPREGRVLAVEKALPKLASGPSSDRKIRSFLAGYLVSRIQPGTLEHFRVLVPILDELRDSVLWYGACAGLTPETAVEDFGDGLGWLLRRELARDYSWLQRPQGDISLTEIELLTSSPETRKPGFRTRNIGTLDVELLPFVTTNVRWGDSPKDVERHVADGGRQASLFPEHEVRVYEVQELLRRIEESSHSLNAIRITVEKAFGEKSPKRPRKGRK
jgi:hypothetical protein